MTTPSAARTPGPTDWEVLALIGPSGVGKSFAAETIARERGRVWIQVDDLRLAIQASHKSMAMQPDHLSFFERSEDVWNHPVDVLRDALINVARLMVPAVRIVIDSHIATHVPLVIEGDGIAPDLAIDPVLRSHVRNGRLRFCCVVPESVEELLENMIARGRGIDRSLPSEQWRQAEMNRAYGEHLVAECVGPGIPVVASRPFATLARRIIQAVEGS